MNITNRNLEELMMKKRTVDIHCKGAKRRDKPIR